MSCVIACLLLVDSLLVADGHLPPNLLTLLPQTHTHRHVLSQSLCHPTPLTQLPQHEPCLAATQPSGIVSSTFSGTALPSRLPTRHPLLRRTSDSTVHSLNTLPDIRNSAGKHHTNLASLRTKPAKHAKARSPKSASPDRSAPQTGQGSKRKGVEKGETQAAAEL